MDTWMDLRFAARTFLKRPGFAVVGTLTLALGIGATTAVFSIVDAVLLRPLPYKDPGRLAAVWLTSTRERGLAKIFATYGDYSEFRRNARSLESVTAATWATRTGRVLTGFGPAREVLTIPASASFFTTLGVSAAIGRTFGAEDEGRGCLVVAAHRIWKSTLGAQRSLIGKSLLLDQKPCTLLGVMPEGFSFYPAQTQFWILMGPEFQDRDRMLAGAFARLKPGVTLAQAETELRGIYRAIHTGDAAGETRDFEPVVYDMHGEFTFLAGRTLGTTLRLVFGAVLLVLLIACVNVANLLPAQLAERQREFSVRAALGSGQGRLVRQVLTEGLLLATLGAVPGIAMAYGAVRLFRVVNPIELTVGADAQVSLPVLVFSIGLSISTTLIFGLPPALRVSRVDLVQHLKAAGRGAVRGGQDLARVIIASEMALSFVLLVAAGLLISSALRMGSEPLGFNPDRVLTTGVSLPVDRYPNDTQRLHVYDRLLERLEQMPDAAGVTLASKVPPDAGGNQILEVRGQPVARCSERHDVGADAVSPGFFRVLNMALRRGRVFGAHDGENSQPVAIVNDALARQYFANRDPLGEQIRIPGGNMPWLTIVGVVGNLKHTQLMDEMSWVETPIFYRPLAQEPRQSMQMAVLARGDMGAVGQAMQKQIAAVDASIPVHDVEALRSRLGKKLAYPRFRALMLALFALGALMLSAVGLHGVLSQLVAQRTAELGVRRAIGAQTHHLFLLMARQGGAPVLAGLTAGISLTLAFSRVLTNLLYGIRPADPHALAMVSVVLLVVAGMAILLPARRAARVDPMVALREE